MPGFEGSQSGFDVLPYSLDIAANSFLDEGSSLVADQASATSELAAFSGMCGDDTVGLQFQSEYQPYADQVIDDVHKLAEALQHMSQKLTAAAAAYRQRDEDVRGLMGGC